MRFYGVVSGKWQEAKLTQINIGTAFLVQGACGMKMLCTPEQLAEVVDWSRYLELSDDEMDVFLAID